MRLLIALALLFAPTAASAQSLTLTNLRGPVAKLCPKVATVTTIAAFWREVAACAAVPVPTLPPPTGVLVMGQSHSVNHVDYWGGAIRRDNPGVNWLPDLNASGAGIAAFEAWLPTVEQRRPAVVVMSVIPEDMIANLPRYNALFCKVSASGAKVVVNNPWATRETTPATRNVAIQCADAIAEFAGHPVMGRQGADDNPLLYRDPIHWTSIPEKGGHAYAYSIWAKAISKVVPVKQIAEPAPPPAPAPPSTEFVAPFDIAKGLEPWGNGAIPGIYNPFEGAFRFVCGGDGKLAFDDPVVYPGQPGKAHLHQAWGSEDFSAATTPDSLRAEPKTNCNATPYSLNRSLYWQPALIHDSGDVIRPDAVVIYYKRPRASSPFCTPGAREFTGLCVPLPDKIRFIFGWDQFNPTAPVTGASWVCTGTTGHFADIEAMFAAGCKAGDTMVANTVAQNCWDGKNLDSADHRSHVTYADYSDGSGFARCPATHPYRIPQEENKVSFTVTADMVTADGKPRIRLSSDHMLAGAKAGQTLHADYMEAWDARAKKLWTDHCIDKGLDCSGGDLGNGQQLIGASQPKYGWVHPSPRAAAPLREHAH